MITAIDTDVLVSLWDADDELNLAALEVLYDAYSGGSLVIWEPYSLNLRHFLDNRKSF